MTYRQIYMDGRALEAAPNPSWMGYSVGRWEETRWLWRATDLTTERGWIAVAILTQRRSTLLNATGARILGTSEYTLTLENQRSTRNRGR